MERGGVRCPPLVLGHLDRLAGQPPQNPRRSRPHQVLTWLQESRLKLTFCRLAAVNTLHLSVVSAELLKVVAEHKGLKRLVMIETKLTEVPANLLAHVVANKREVNLGASEGHSGSGEAKFSAVNVDLEERQPLLLGSQLLAAVTHPLARA